ncbi:MAG: uroporphyrinogen decarboxylase family protein [Anaerolineae bacterium]|jgi:uroporphyrinogen-III decarboxylase|nr:uroporphyrinogen decarboxylase family protein [Anaerolineae bacterium]
MSEQHRMPVSLIFNPNWWFHNAGISFDASFYFDREARIRNDVVMRRVLYERFGLGEQAPQPRPIVGSRHVAGGFVIPALFGIEIRFSANEAPWPVTLNLGDAEIMALEVPDIETTWPMDRLIADMDALEHDFGYVMGDFDTDSVINTALQLRGQQLFLDFFEKPELVHHLFDVVARTTARVASYVKARTGTSSVSTNRSILQVDPAIYLHSNCSVQMVSPKTYEAFLLPYEQYMAEQLPPYGIHHCGNNLHRFAKAYAKVPVVFFDVGWGSDVAQCREALPEAFLNLRLSPVRMLQQPVDEIRRDVEGLLHAVGSLEHIGLCCINMDAGTPDENVKALLEAAVISDLNQ